MTTSLRKAAVLLASLPEADTAALLAQLEPHQLAALAAEIAMAPPPGAIEQAVVLQDLLRRAQGEVRTSTPRAPAENQDRFAYLHNIDSPTIAQALRDEHLQTIALVLSFLPHAQRDRTLAFLPADTSFQVSQRLAMLGQVCPGVVDDIERGLEQNLAVALRKWLPEAA